MSVQAKKSQLEIWSGKGWLRATYRQRDSTQNKSDHFSPSHVRSITIITIPTICLTKIYISTMFCETQDNAFIQRVEKRNIETSSSFFFVFFFCQIIRICMKNTCDPAIFFADAYSIFSSFKRHHEIPLLRIQNLTFGSPLFLKWSFSRWQFWHEIGHMTLSCTGPITAMSSDQKSHDHWYSSTILMNRS